MSKSSIGPNLGRRLSQIRTTPVLSGPILDIAGSILDIAGPNPDMNGPISGLQLVYTFP